jgi:chromosome partitioning protein
MRVITVLNQKGGVGKTTTTVNLAHALAMRGRQVLMLDLDPQGHLAASLGIHPAPRLGVVEALVEGLPLHAHAVAVHDWGTLIPAGQALAEHEQLPGGLERAACLREAISSLRTDCDTLLIDCPPAAGMLMVNAVVAADDILIPVAGDYLSLTGLARLMLALKRLAPLSKSGLRQWVCMSRFVAHRRLAREVRAKVSQHFPDKLLPTAISEAAVLAECAGVGKTVFEYRGKGRSAMEFLSLADDLLHNRVVANEQEAHSDVA